MAVWPRHFDRRIADSELFHLAKMVGGPDAATMAFGVTTTKPIGGTFATIESRPFGVSVGQPGMTETELDAITGIFGFRPTSAIHAFAYANSAADHVILGEVARFLAQRLAGLVDFGGNLGRNVPSVGLIAEVPYEDGAGTPSTFHVGDATFLTSWLTHPAFHMIK